MFCFFGEYKESKDTVHNASETPFISSILHRTVGEETTARNLPVYAAIMSKHLHHRELEMVSVSLGSLSHWELSWLRTVTKSCCHPLSPALLFGFGPLGVDLCHGCHFLALSEFDYKILQPSC